MREWGVGEEGEKGPLCGWVCPASRRNTEGKWEAIMLAVVVCSFIIVPRKPAGKTVGFFPHLMSHIVGMGVG